MEFIFEILFQFLAELFLQFFGELLIEIGLHSLAEPFRRKPNPYLAALGYTLFGALIGLLSLTLFPSHFIHSYPLRLANLVLTPIALGSLMSAVGLLRRSRHQQPISLDKFSYGYLFALTTSLIRLFLAH